MRSSVSRSHSIQGKSNQTKGYLRVEVDHSEEDPVVNEDVDQDVALHFLETNKMMQKLQNWR